MPTWTEYRAEQFGIELPEPRGPVPTVREAAAQLEAARAALAEAESAHQEAKTALATARQVYSEARRYAAANNHVDGDVALFDLTGGDTQ